MTDITLSPLLTSLAEGNELTPAQLEQAFDALLSGHVPAEQIGAFLMALAVRGETGAELLAGARTLRAHARHITLEGPTLDTCGTGGLNWTSLNTSTASAILVAACGGKVAKHGNRSVPPKTGSADVLEALGLALELDAERFQACMESAGVGFLFARAHHRATRPVAPVRASLGSRTIVTLLGPLSNPASASHQVLGVSQARWLQPMAEALRDLGIHRAWVVHGQDEHGQCIDELSIAGPTKIIEVNQGGLSTFTVTPSDAGLAQHPLSALAGGSPSHNARAIRDLLDGQAGAFRDAVVLNAGAGLCVLGQSADLKDGAAQAACAIDTGAARQTLDKLIDASRCRS